MDAQVPPDATKDQLKVIADDAEARKNAYEALKKAEDAKHAFETLQDSAKQALADQTASAKAAKDLADAETAKANAQKAQADAQLAATKAKFGDIPASGYGGIATIGTGAGTAEAVLLSAIAVNEIAKEFTTRIRADLPQGSKLVLTTSTTVPDFQALMAFNAQFESFQAAIIRAQQTTDVAEAAKIDVKKEAVAEIGLGLEAINKMLAFAKTDYSFLTFEIQSSDAMLLSALAHCLMAAKMVVEIPSLYLPEALAAPNVVLEKTSKMYQWSSEAKRNIKLFETAQAIIEKQLAGLPNDQDLKNKLQKFKESLATWKTISDAVDAWIKQATSADDKGNVPLATIIRQSAIKKKLESGSALLVTQLHKAVGTGYAEKNLLSSLGRNPFFVAAGAVAGYIALDGKSGEVLSSMLLPVHGGYHSVSDVKGVVNNAAH